MGVEGINPVVGHTKGVFFLPHAETLYCHSWGNLPGDTVKRQKFKHNEVNV